MEVICYVSVAIFLCLLSLFIYGMFKNTPKYMDDDTLGGMLFMSIIWPITIALVILFCVGQLPILLGEYVGKLREKNQAKKEFKETINKKNN